ncbi:hypothetical protein VNI00_012913 [Paramarasmius palmivorus]|uniref:Uncharacterized protein n=1 Tax=Paramarasmius palmivorus TaxID=297713 RepID=A0AAW0C236_9AGAR
MAPIAFAVTPVLLVVLVSVAFFALSGFALFKLRTSIAASRPVDVEAAMSQLQTRLVPVVGRLGFDGHQMALRDTLGRLIRVRAGIDPNAGSEAMLLARPESIFVQEPPKTIQQSEPGLVPSSSFEVWTSSLCELIEDFAGVERTPKTFHQSSLGSGLVASSSFEVWAATLCDLISDFASPAPFRSGFTPLIDTFEDDPYIFDTYDTYDTMPKTNIIIPDIMVTPPSPRLEEDVDQPLFAPGLLASPSFACVAAECVEELDDDAEATAIIEDNVEIKDSAPIALAEEPLDQFADTQNEPVLSLSFRYGSTLSTEMPAIVSGPDSEEHTTEHKKSHSQYLSPSSTLSVPPIVEEPVWENYEPEGELKSVFESDSEDDETYYSRRPHLSRPGAPPASQSMSTLLRSIVEKRKSQQKLKDDKENAGPRDKKHSRTSKHKRRFFSKTFATPSAPLNTIRVPNIKFTPPTPPRRGVKREMDSGDGGMDLDMGIGMGMGMDEGLERVAFDLVVDDYGRCFF